MMQPMDPIPGIPEEVPEEDNLAVKAGDNVKSLQGSTAEVAHENSALLNAKVDQLIETVKELKLTSSTHADVKQFPRQSNLPQFQNSNEWKDIKNIIDLTEAVPEI
jgi:hypothetical protein